MECYVWFCLCRAVEVLQPACLLGEHDLMGATVLTDGLSFAGGHATCKVSYGSTKRRANNNTAAVTVMAVTTADNS
jgi:hypothetical protein